MQRRQGGYIKPPFFINFTYCSKRSGDLCSGDREDMLSLPFLLILHNAARSSETFAADKNHRCRISSHLRKMILRCYATLNCERANYCNCCCAMQLILTIQATYQIHFKAFQSGKITENFSFTGNLGYLQFTISLEMRGEE